MASRDTVNSVRVPRKTLHDTQNYDTVLESFGKAIDQKSCSTCDHFRQEYGIYPRCSAEGSDQVPSGWKVLFPEKGLETKGQCTTNYVKSPKWKICKGLQIETFLKSNSQLNEFLEGDLYEVYEHFTGDFIQVPSGWFSMKKVRESFFYILKNGQGYFCKSPHSLERGFLPLDDFTTMVERGLITYTNASEAIEQCETFSSWGNKKGNLVYSTGDSLESRFRKLEEKAG